MRIKKLALFSLVAALVLGGLSAAAVASDPAHDRHMAMEEVNDAMKALGAIAKQQAPFDAAVVKKNATTITEKLKEASTLFPPGSHGGESLAKPEIWTDAAAFEKGMKEAQAAAIALQGVSDEAAFRPALGRLGAGCKSCHDKYRLPPKH